MKLEGKEGVVTHYLMDVGNRLGDLTVVSYTHDLRVLVCLLRDLYQVTELEQVTVLHLRQCVQHLLTTPVEQHGGRLPFGEHLAPSSVNTYIRVWKAFFNWCFQEELIQVNPAVRLKPVKVEKRVTPAFLTGHIDRMLAACDTRKLHGFRDHVILLLLLDTGMRISEIAGLKLEDVNFQGGYVKVYGKGRREREIGIHPEMSKLLWKYIQKHRNPSNPNERALFLGQKGRLSSSGVHYIVKTVQAKSGLEDIEFHAHVFRHTFAKMYLERGGDLFKLSREMGHSDVKVTKLYLEDFGSTEARKDHTAHSPLEGMNFTNRKKKSRG